MASCKTIQWSAGAPYVKLTVVKKTYTTQKVTLSYRLEYVSETAVVTDGLKDFTIFIANTTVAVGKFDLNKKTGLNFVSAGTVTLPITATTENIPFKVAFDFQLAKSDGTIIGILEASGSIPVASNAVYTACGIPTTMSITDNGNNTITISCKVGSNGTNNLSEGVDLYITCDGTAPSVSNYKYRYTLWGLAGETVSETISFAGLPEVAVARIFGASCAGNIKVTARTIGDAGTTYYSAISESKSMPFIWRGSTKAPKIITPSKTTDTAGLLTNYLVTWESGAGGINNAISKYALSVYNVTTGKIVATYSTTNLSYEVPLSNFIANNVYRFYVVTVGASSGFDGTAVVSSPLLIKAIDKFPAPTLAVSDGGTVPSIDYLTSKTYVNIGSGNVLKLSWNTPTANNNEVDSYKVYITAYDTASASYTPLYEANIGNVNEFYLKSTIFEAIPQSFISLAIRIEVISKYGASYSGMSSIKYISVSNGAGTYTRVATGYAQPIMKRSLAFTKLSFIPLLANDGIMLASADGKTLLNKASSIQDPVTGWTLMQEFLVKKTDILALLDNTGAVLLDNTNLPMYARSDNSTWLPSDIRYEALTDTDDKLITDINNENIFVL